MMILVDYRYSLCFVRTFSCRCFPMHLAGFSFAIVLLIEFVRADCAVKMDNLSTEMNDKVHQLNDNIDERIDFLERQTKLCDVVIKNIPYRQDENMQNIVHDICGAINYKNTSAIKTAFR